MNIKKRYAQVGLGGRSTMFTDAMVGNFKKYCDIVALCDINQGRMDLCNRRIQVLITKILLSFIP